MLNRRGSTLISTLFAFEIYVVVLVLFMTMMTGMRASRQRLSQQSDMWHILQQSKGDDEPLKDIARVLHS